MSIGKYLEGSKIRVLGEDVDGFSVKNYIPGVLVIEMTSDVGIIARDVETDEKYFFSWEGLRFKFVEGD